ncbi:uncharacterized protein A4U43_C06F220 [Asparagus officinalis]|uniref:Uncharacterized protein n=1 Tax=Asparagus officinalis TaxID=4686 RepID=A0A5P1EID8_ASPOF|nr:uncharacterized protein A4U43_C06F220 [Asparagus officinalis]
MMQQEEQNHRGRLARRFSFRHREEMRELRNGEMSPKRAAAKGSKSEQKAKKKQVEDEVSHLLSQLEGKHSKDLSSSCYKNPGLKKDNLDNLQMAVAGASIKTTEKDTMKHTMVAFEDKREEHKKKLQESKGYKNKATSLVT